MKKILFFVSMLSLLLVTGCGKYDSDNKNQNNSDINVDEKSLEGYPKDILPIYKPIDIEDTSFSYRDDYDYIVGKDIYIVSYISDADKDAISNYYLSLLTQIDDKDEEWFDKYIFTGAIGDNNVIISISDTYDDSENVRVGLTIGLTEEEYVDENPFFSNYPDDLVDVYRNIGLQEVTYKKGYFYERNVYITIYQTDMTEEEFLSYYKPKYEKMSNFSNEKDDYGNKMIWDDRGYNINLTYNKSGGYNSISIYAYSND